LSESVDKHFHIECRFAPFTDLSAILQTEPAYMTGE